MRFILMILLIAGVCGCHFNKKNYIPINKIKSETVEQLSKYSDPVFRSRITWKLDYYIKTGMISKSEGGKLIHSIIREYTNKLLKSTERDYAERFKVILMNAIWKLKYYHNKDSLPIIKRLIVNERLCKKYIKIRKEALATYLSLGDKDYYPFLFLKDARNEPEFSYEIQRFICEQCLGKLEFEKNTLEKNDWFYDLLDAYIFNNNDLDIAYKKDKLFLKLFGDRYKKSSYRLNSIKAALSEIPENGSTFFRNYFTNIIKYFNMLPLKEVNDSYPDDWSK